jgi:hypothetical protein
MTSVMVIVLTPELGTVYTWGDNSYGQLGHGSTEPVFEPRIVENLRSPVVDLACGHHQIWLLLEDGSFWVCGRGDNSKLGLGSEDQENRHSFVQNPFVSGIVVRVYSGSSHGLVLTKDKKLYGWGWNGLGNVGAGTGRHPVHLPALILEDVEDVSCGGSHSLALLRDGSLYSWGFNNHGQCGDGTTNSVFTPKPVLLPFDSSLLVGFGCGWYHSYVITRDGSLYIWGAGEEGQVGLGTKEKVLEPTLLSGLKIRLPRRGRREVVVRAWATCFKWLFMGNIDPSSELSTLPVEVLFHMVECWQF